MHMQRAWFANHANNENGRVAAPVITRPLMTVAQSSRTTLADLIPLIEQANLSPIQKRDQISAVKTIARLLGATPAEIDADPIRLAPVDGPERTDVEEPGKASPVRRRQDGRALPRPAAAYTPRGRKGPARAEAQGGGRPIGGGDWDCCRQFPSGSATSPGSTCART